MVRIVYIDLNRRDIAGAIEIGLGLPQRHEHKCGVVFRHADFEDRHHPVRLDARRRAHRRHRAARRNQSQIIANLQRQLVGKSAADGDALALVESVERALLDVVGDRTELGKVGAPNAAHQHPVGVEWRRRQRLAFHHRCRKAHALHLRYAHRHLIPIGERRIDRLDQHMAIEPENLVKQLLAEAIHHRHHDNEGRHSNGEAEERDRGDERNKPLAPPRAQIAHRQHPFE